jgi:hypothetical protein
MKRTLFLKVHQTVRTKTGDAMIFRWFWKNQKRYCPGHLFIALI